MSRLRVIVRPGLAPGFELAGVETYGVDDVEAAEDLVRAWLLSGKAGLVAIDQSLLVNMNPALVRRLDSSKQLHYLAIPGASPSDIGITRRSRISGMIRRTIGVHIAFGDEDAKSERH